MATAKTYGTLEETWLELIEAGPAEPAPFLAAADALERDAERTRAADLLRLLAASLRERGRPAEALEVLRRLARLAPDDPKGELRTELVEALKRAHDGRPGLDAFLKRAGLAASTDARPAPLPRALEAFDAFLDYARPGRHVHHAAGWGVGRVIEVDGRTGELTIDFERKKGHALPVESAREFLTRLPDDHIWSLKHSSPDRVRELVEANPAELVKVVIQSRGGKATLAQVKQELLGSAVSEKGWSKFWSKAKTALLHDPYVEITDDARPVLALRERPVTLAAETLERFAAAKTLAEATEVARQFLQKSPDAPPEPRATLAEALSARASGRRGGAADDAPPGALVEAAYALDDLGHPAPTGSPLAEAVKGLESDAGRLRATLETMASPELKRRYLDRARAARPDAWVGAFAAVVPHLDKDAFGALAQALEQGGDEARRALGRALADLAEAPEPEAEPFLQMVKDIFAGRFADVPGAPTPLRVVERVMAFSERQERGRADREPTARLRAHQRPGETRPPPSKASSLPAKVRALLADREHAALRRYFLEAPRDSARLLYPRIMSSRWVDDESREAVRIVVVRRFPDLLAPARPFWEDGNLYMTTKGLKRLEGEFQELANVKIPENARAIGAAAALGDLSENAEFTAALEERDRLVARADRLKKELERARPLEGVEVPSDRVAPGTRVTLRHVETGAGERYTLLGPYDVDVEAGVISYTASLARGLLGRSVGDEVVVELPGVKARYAVEAIERAI